MKKFLMTLAALLCCVMTTAVFTACGDEDTPTTYRYQVALDKRSSQYVDQVLYNATEEKEVLDALNQAIKYDGTVYTHYSEKQDDLMKAACEAVKKEYADKVPNSIYMKFDLYRIDSETGQSEMAEIIGSYELGQALTKPYVTYSIVTNHDEAYKALKTKQASLDTKVYEATFNTLKTLVGLHTVVTDTLSSGAISTKYYDLHSVFEDHFKDMFGNLYLDSENGSNTIISYCDSVADSHANDTLTVEAVVAIQKTNFLTNECADVWRKTFQSNYHK
ncbi:hypothetical protein L6466_00490 [Prevotella communis]|uniref:Lipoprotein n=1 Tax=Prevotella communis TaxID=2913614 RepID=A0A1H0G8X9_9BACT|nr:hypothetical protein [Prevotella communis]UKK62123.1 hypothetical protein L6468_14270 [Prevotella communis]UKK64950.1 hypothetical protein L6473_14280 [Prevotella communis]UKK70535.1 hypothetical protein L6466_00490 [Prevotella communis]SDO03316.1 hypothetical protein SAMN04487900_1087 [Prevotella communis]